MMDRRRFLQVASTAFGGLTQAPKVFSARASAPTGQAQAPKIEPPRHGASSRTIPIADLVPRRLATRSDTVCKVLQVTDLHLFKQTPAEDERTLSDCERLISKHTPDLAILTGDLWQDNPEGKGQGFLEAAVKRFSAWGVPWTICWGNHDLLPDFQKGHDLLENAANSVYCGGATHGDYRLEVIRRGGTAPAAPVLDILCLNSGDLGLGPWQAEALKGMTRRLRETRSKPAPAIMFFHIPIAEYGGRLRPETFSGTKFEDVSSHNEKGVTFPAIREAKTIRACFCGHNHTNDFTVVADGISLHYGRSTGYAGYGGDKVRKGAKLIEVDLADGKCRQTTVFADGSQAVA